MRPEDGQQDSYRCGLMGIRPVNAGIGTQCRAEDPSADGEKGISEML